MIQNSSDVKQKPPVKIILLLGLLLLIILNFTATINILKNVYGVIFPLLFGAVIAYVLNILVSGYERIYFPKSIKKIFTSTRRGVCILLSLITIVLVLLFFLRILIPQVNQFIDLLVAGFPTIYDRAIKWAVQFADDLPALQQQINSLNMDGTTALKKAMEILGNWTGGAVSLVGTIFGKIMNFILAAIFSIYILFGKEDLKNRFTKLIDTYMKKDRRKKFYYIMQTANESFYSYIVGQCKEAVILGALCTIGMLVFRFPYATIIGPVIGLTALIPMIGAYIGAAVGFLLIIMVDPVKAALFVIFIVVLQQIEGNLIYPKVVGQSVGLPGIWVFAAITVGGGLLGITGILFGVPVFATVYKLLDKSINERNKLSEKQRQATGRGN